MPTAASDSISRRRFDDAHVEDLLSELSRTHDRDRKHRLRQEVVLLSMELADGVALRFAGRGVDVDDLQQVARLALVKAAAGYRADRGGSFAAYAVPTISGEIKRHFRDFGWVVRPPRRLQELRARVVAEEEVLRQRLGREPTCQDVAGALGLRRRDVDAAHACSTAYRALSLDQPHTPGVDGLFAEDDAVESFLRRDVLGRALADLTERDRRILRLRFVDELTQSQIGARVGVSQMQVSRLLARILDRLHTALQERPSEDQGAA